MSAIVPRPMPPGAFLARYAGEGAYTDCYAMDLPRRIGFGEYVEAFYTTPLFRLERMLLASFARRPSTDAEARELAQGRRDAFSAWTVEQRGEGQLLLCDVAGRTRSWLMAHGIGAGDQGGTRLYFGSAVVPLGHARDGTPRFGAAFHALSGFHRLYTRALMGSARSRLLAAERR